MNELTTPQIQAELLRLVEGGVREETLAERRALLHLDVVVGLATTGGRHDVSLRGLCAALHRTLIDCCDALDENPARETEPNEAIAAKAALALWRGTQGVPLRGDRGGAGRLPVIAHWLAADADNLTRASGGLSRLDRLIRRLAVELYNRETTYIGEALRLQQRAVRRPAETLLRIDWFASFTAYARIWLPVSGLQSTLSTYFAPHAADNRLDAARMSLFYFAHYLVRLNQFEEECGGMWITPSRENEQVLAEGTVALRKLSPFTELDQSVIRLAYKAWPEPAEFVYSMSRDAALARMVERWVTWLAECSCDVTMECRPHRMLEWAGAMMDTVIAEWSKLADWYDEKRVEPKIDLTRSASGDFPRPGDYR